MEMPLYHRDFVTTLRSILWMNPYVEEGPLFAHPEHPAKWMVDKLIAHATKQQIIYNQLLNPTDPLPTFGHGGPDS